MLSQFQRSQLLFLKLYVTQRNEFCGAGSNAVDRGEYLTSLE